jgi:hypothetical protein
MKRLGEKREKLIRKVTGYLGKFGQCRFFDYDFDVEQGPVYANLEVITEPNLAEGLESFINEEINPRGIKNVPAKIQFIRLSQEGGKIRYTAEIVPETDFELPSEYNIPEDSSREKEKMKYATDLFLNSLPSALENLRQKKICLR